MKVVVGMSGGVDSSVSALLLKEQGYEVIGLYMKNWEDLDGSCPGTADYEDVVRVCDTLQIPCYTINFVQEYQDSVFSHFIEELKMGYTPNPDVLCNREIKFKALFQKAKELGADFLATGHYAQTHEGELLRSADLDKDQTYFLYALKKEILNQVLFPIGHLKKKEVRALAEARGLATAAKKDSTGICFIGKRNFREFLGGYIAYKEGAFETLGGKKVGTHQGASFYTIGQRKGLKIGGPGEAWFVVGKNVERNVVLVEQGQDHPALYRPSLEATDVSWIDKAPQFPLRCTAKIRYRQQDQVCTVTQNENDRLSVEFDSPQRAITPRQAIVFYQGPRCLGGALIAPSF
ncbi:MAG: tRNA 2-thiouridine(34) synthase MnmA [Rhabdochlamydiaceae bacterium]|nr:tRNA 2-thiouridine(34) synthase MnmA [Rhabdochlamydiaceae bacterium]